MTSGTSVSMPASSSAEPVAEATFDLNAFSPVACFSHPGAFSYSDVYGCHVDPPVAADDEPDERRRRGRGPSIEAVRRSVVDRAIALAPAPELQIAPARVGVTGLPSFFWIEPPQPITASAGVRGVTVTATAAPSQYLWSFGDGSQETTDDPGRAWTRKRDGTIEHTYETEGRYDVSVTIVWSASWRLNGGPPQSLGTFTTSDAAEYPVREVIAFLTTD